MKWLRNVVVDLAATLVILAWVVGQGAAWLGWAVWIYTPLMLVLKLGALSLGRLLGRANRGDVPAWFYHFSYAANVALLVYGGQTAAAPSARSGWILAAMWAAIWALSVLAARRAKQQRAARS